MPLPMINSHPNCPEDQELLDGISQNGSARQKAIMLMFDRYAYFVKYGMGKYRLSEEEAQTAYNETVLAGLKAIDRGSFRGDSCIKTYLHTIFRNKCVNEIRSGRSNQLEDNLEDFVHLPDKAQDILAKLDLKYRLQHTIELLQNLGKKCVDILLMTAKGFSSQEIALELGYKDDNTVNVLRRRCRAGLLKQLG